METTQKREWKWSKPELGQIERSKRRLKGDLNEVTKINPDEIDELPCTKREDLFSKYTRNDKIDSYRTAFQSGREWVSQINTNPFLQGNDYLNDLKNEDTFLRPRNTNIDENYLKNNTDD